MDKEFGKIVDRVSGLTGARTRKYYSDYDVAPSNDEVAKAVKGIQGEVSDQLAYTMEAVKLLVAIKDRLSIIAFASVAVAAVAVRYAFVSRLFDWPWSQ